jgi:negative regulator of flagellin synthesis FlgM
MTNKIDNQGFRPLDTSGGTRRSEGVSSDSRPAASGGSQASTGDTVNITRSGVLLQKLEETLASVPVVDAERVSAIRDAIKSGSYQIDAAAIADQIIRLDRELS